jgi:hypothetical protein
MAPAPSEGAPTPDPSESHDPGEALAETAAPPCGGQLVSVTLVVGAIERQFELSCKDEKVTLRAFESPIGSDETLKRKNVKVTREDWNQVWRAIEEADWTALPEISRCPDEEWAETDKVLIRDGGRHRIVALCRQSDLPAAQARIAAVAQSIARKE